MMCRLRPAPLASDCFEYPVPLVIEMFLRTLFALTCISALLTAQSGGDEDAGRAQRKRAAIEQGGEFTEDGSDLSKEGGKGKGDDEWEKLTPEQRLNRNVRHGAQAYCTFVATPKPAKLMPGQSGVIVVTAVLKGAAVIPSPAPLEVISAPQQGLATVGLPAFHPAEAGRGLAKGYVGKPVYDNYAIFEVPVTMSPQAEIGRKQAVSIEMRFDLFDGSSAQSIGRFLDRASAEIEVGQALNPRVQGGGVPAAAERVVKPDAGTGTADDADQKVPADQGRKVEVVDAQPVSMPAVGQDPTMAVGPSGPAPAVEESALPMPVLLGAGGVLVLVLVLLLARRK